MSNKTENTVSVIDTIRRAFRPESLKWMCEADPSDIKDMFEMTRASVAQPAPDDFYLFKDNGSRVLAVAHLDTVQTDRFTAVVDTAAGPVVHSGALDDRLGAYVLGCLLPALSDDYRFDLLFTTGEESGSSTASFFEPSVHHDRGYDWVIEFDRGGTDVVLYQYEDDDLIERVVATGARVGDGAFSDISFLEHLGVKCLNWGVGYRDYHSIRGHAYLEDTFKMVNHFLRFFEDNNGVRLPHEDTGRSMFSRRWTPSWSSDSSRIGSSFFDVEDLTGDDEEKVCVESKYDSDSCEGEVEFIYGDFVCGHHAEWYK